VAGGAGLAWFAGVAAGSWLAEPTRIADSAGLAIARLARTVGLPGRDRRSAAGRAVAAGTGLGRLAEIRTSRLVSRARVSGLAIAGLAIAGLAVAVGVPGVVGHLVSRQPGNALACRQVLIGRTGLWAWNLGLLAIAAALIFPHLHHPYPVPAYFPAAAGPDPATDAKPPRLAGGGGFSRSATGDLTCR
jgi:hypothetical protein